MPSCYSAAWRLVGRVGLAVVPDCDVLATDWHRQAAMLEIAAMRQYQELRRLTPDGIRARNLPETAAVLADLAGAASELSRSVDLALLQASQAAANPLPLLCLRCRISHALEAWLVAAYKAHRGHHGIELEEMASYGLDDDGAPTIRTRPDTRVPFVYAELASLPEGLVSPFSAEVLRSYEPSRSGLPHWARLKIQAHNELKAYFKQHGLLLISDWALLRNTSPQRIQQACQEQVRGSDSIAVLCELHGHYCPLYDAAKRDYKVRTGKASGWQPDLAFLRELSPDQEPFDTHDRLKAIARAVRLLLTSTTRSSSSAAAELAVQVADPRSFDTAPDEGESPAELKGLIDAALDRAIEPAVRAALAADQPSWAAAPERRKAWLLYGRGLGQRQIAEQCGHKQGWVSKLLSEKVISSSIAIAAAVELKRHPAFASVSRSVEGAERLMEALRNHLLSPEREGDVAPLRCAVAAILATLAS
jgi:hypothetical protein